jgi:hypothetical protein
MSGRVKLWIGAAIIVVAGSASSAHAQFGFGPGAYGLGFFNYGNNQPRIPYYALYPPVYYSYPVARTYGYSPFAYPPGTPTPELAQPAAAIEIRNPYVPSPSPPRPQPTADRSAAAPRMYYNPYVAKARSAGSAELAAESLP